jgi:hypothetical protein
VARLGVVRFGEARHGQVWLGAVRLGWARCGGPWFGAAGRWSGVVRHGKAWCGLKVYSHKFSTSSDYALNHCTALAIPKSLPEVLR